MSTPITVVCVDDHPLIRQAIRYQIENAEGLLFLAEGSVGDEVIELVRQHHPDVLLLDIEMPQSQTADSERFQLIPSIRKMRQFFQETSIIIVSQHLSQALLEVGITRGVNGYLLKSDALTLSLPRAIRTVHQGGFYFSKGISERLFARDTVMKDGLITRRQKQILLAIVEQPNLTYAEHAEQLGISEGTLKNRLSELFKRVGVKNITACLIEAIRTGLISLPD